MKNKKLIVVVVLLFLFLSVSFIKDKQKMVAKGKEKDIPVVGVLQFVSHPALDEIYQGMLDELNKQGFQNGKTVKIIFQNGQADQSKLTSMSQHLLNEKADVLVGIATPSAQSLLNQTKDVPIVLGAVSDPKGAGLVKDNLHPGGNVTGVSDQSPVKAQLELVEKLLPKKKKMGVLYSSAEDNSAYQVKKITEEAQKDKFEVHSYAVPSTNEISQMMQVISEEVDFLYIPTDNTMANAMQTIVDVANQHKLPIIPSVDSMVEQGGLATVGINQHQLGVQTGKMVADILNKKSQPANTPIYTFKDGDTIINKDQANFLGIEIPKEILEHATIKGGIK